MECKTINTGLKTLTGGRLKRVSKFLKEEEFFFTYGDGVAKFNMQNQVKFHRTNKKICTVLAVRPPSRYRALEIKKNGQVKTFDEKPEKGEDYINGGYLYYHQNVSNISLVIAQCGKQMF